MNIDGRLGTSEATTPEIPWLNGLSFLGLFTSWLYFNRATLQWFSDVPSQFSRFNLCLLGAAFLIFAYQAWKQRLRLLKSFSPRLHPLPLSILFGSAIAAIIWQWNFDLEPLTGALFILGTYGLIGLFLPLPLWKKGLTFCGAIAILLLTGLGPLPRSFIAEIVEFILKPFHIQAISSENILVLDTGIAFIDLPCSGRKSLWAGSLFLLLATVFEKRQMNLRWFGLYIGNLLLLLSANVLRILSLVIFTYVLKQPAIAEIIHVPFGLMSFVTVCIITWGLLRFIPQIPTTESVDTKAPQKPSKLISLFSVGLAVIGLSFIPLPAHSQINPESFENLALSAPIQTETISLNSPEQKFFATYPGVVTKKKTFEIDGLTGSMIWVMSPTWRAHHAPELCITANGYRVNHMESKTLSANISGRWLSLNQDQQNAAYWFQSPQQTTGNYLHRLWSEITREDDQWTMVSVLFDQAVTPDNPQVQTLLTDIQGAIASSFS